MKKPLPEPEHCPTMGGTCMGYKPQWKHADVVSQVGNERLGLTQKDGWHDVPFQIHRGNVAVRLPSGDIAPLGIPFPRHQPGILETIYMCGYEQAHALAWSFAAHIASLGGRVEIRAEAYELKYDIKAKIYRGKDSPTDIGQCHE